MWMRNWKDSQLHYIRPEGERPKKRWKDLEPIEKFNFWLVIFTALLALIGAMQYRAFMQSERAFVGMENFAFDSELQADTPLIILGNIKNYGKSVAIIHKINATVQFELPDIPAYNRTNFAVPPIPPEGSTISVIEPGTDNGESFIVTQKHIDALKDGAIKVYIYGYINYGDDYSVLLGDREMGFCYFYWTDPNDQNMHSFRTCSNPAYIYVK